MQIMLVRNDPIEPFFLLLLF